MDGRALIVTLGQADRVLPLLSPSADLLDRRVELKLKRRRLRLIGRSRPFALGQAHRVELIGVPAYGSR